MLRTVPPAHLQQVVNSCCRLMVDEASKKALSPLLFRLSKEEGVGDKLAVDKSLERPLVDTSEENTVFLQVGIFFNAILNH